MNEDRTELLNTFIKMSPENQANLLDCFRIVYASQENAKHAMVEKSGGAERDNGQQKVWANS